MSDTFTFLVKISPWVKTCSICNIIPPNTRYFCFQLGDNNIYFEYNLCFSCAMKSMHVPVNPDGYAIIDEIDIDEYPEDCEDSFG